MNSTTHLLWRKAPLLYYSLFLLLALLFTWQTFWSILFLPFLLWKQPLRKAMIGIGLFLCMIAYLQHLYFFPPTEYRAYCHFRPTSLSPMQKSFQKGVLYKGYISQLIDEEGKKQRCHLPTTVRLKEPLEPGYDYLIHSVLRTKNRFYYSLHPLGILEKSHPHFSLMKIRTIGKKWFQNYIHRHYQEDKSAPFLTALTTGLQEDSLLKAELTQIGCAHLLAISGFHFALIATFCHLLLRPFFHYKVHHSLLLLLLLSYYLFLGKSASILRALIFSSCFFVGPLLERRSSPLNALGIALSLSLLLDPTMGLELGFCLSFLATGAILIFYPALRTLLVKKNGGRIRRFFEETMALNLAVHGALLPLMILYFHAISIHSIIYNLFFPSLTAFCLMIFLAASLLFLFCPPLGHLVHLLNNYYTEWFVSLAEKRLLYEKSFFVEEIAPYMMVTLFLILYLCVLKATEEK